MASIVITMLLGGLIAATGEVPTVVALFTAIAIVGTVNTIAGARCYRETEKDQRRQPTYARLSTLITFVAGIRSATIWRVEMLDRGNSALQAIMR